MWNFTKFGKNSHFSTSVVWKNWNSSSCGEIPCTEIWNFSTWQISSPPTCRWPRWQISGMPRPSPFNLHPVLYILNTFMHCQIVMRIQKHRQTDDTSGKWPTRFFMCVFKFIHSCVWKGCVISCVFISYVSSNPLPKKKHSHIGCICLTFLHCGFANVPSNCLHEKNHGHIGCICMTFLQCGFSNVSSNRLPKKKHSCIGCICLTYLHCGFSIFFFFK